ncbi:hypothetical protein BDW62DRAFT_205313 [Aspergillus aurantiobrunneus]
MADWTCGLSASGAYLVQRRVTQARRHIIIDEPIFGDTVATDNFKLEWTFDFYDEGDFGVALRFHDFDIIKYSGDVFSTVVHAPDVSTTIPASVLPSLSPGESTAFDLFIAQTSGSIGTVASSITLFAQSTTTQTVIATIVDTSTLPGDITSWDTYRSTPAPTASGDYYRDDPSYYDDNEEGEGEGGLSPGATAGIAVGAAAGALLLAAVGFILCRRHKKNEPSRTIREISTMDPGTAAFLNGSIQNQVGHIAAEKGKPVGLTAEKNLSASASGRQSGERYELP